MDWHTIIEVIFVVIIGMLSISLIAQMKETNKLREKMQDFNKRLYKEMNTRTDQYNNLVERFEILKKNVYTRDPQNQVWGDDSGPY